MIITDIKQIDRLAEEVLTRSSAYVVVDMNDYATLKERSASLKAITLEAPELTAETASALGRDFTEADNGKVRNILLYINGKGGDAGIKTLTATQLQMLLNAIQSPAGTANIIWGLGDSETETDCITLLVILGYSE